MLGQARAARAEAGRALAQARIELASTWGSAAPLFASAAGDLAVLAPPATLDSLLQSIVGNPGVGRWESEQARRRALLSLEQAQRIPDLTVSAGARHFADGDDAAMVFGLAVPLPLFDRNQGSILAAERALTQATSAERAASVAAEAALRRSHAALSAAFDEATELRDSAIPNASRTYEGARTAYSRGLFRYLEVLDAQRTLYELRGQYVDTLERYHLAAISIARVTGSLRAPTSAATDEVQLR
jgi:cobalt-zinc-cadmium efflux system outer membrane protein